MTALTELSDEILVSRLQQGDELAFNAIYTRYWEKLYAIAYNRLKDQFIAEDIVHDIFALVWQRRQEITPDSLSAYLAAAVKYAVLSYYRKEDSAQKYISQQKQHFQIEPGIDNQLHHKRILQMVHKEIERLPQRCNT